MARWFATFRKLQIGIGTSVAIFSRNPIYPTNPSHPGKNRDSSTGWTSNTTRLQKPPLLRRSCPLLAKSNTISTLARNRTAPPRRNRQAVKKSGIGFSPTPRVYKHTSASYFFAGAALVLVLLTALAAGAVVA